VTELLSSGLVDAADLEWLRSHLDRLRQLAAPALTRFTVKFVDDAEMVRLHGQFLGDPTTTDVMTFADGSEVDLAVCVPEARRRAGELGHGMREELLLYGLHGLLHATGFDDRTPEAFAAMHAEEDRLLAAVGLDFRFGQGKYYSGPS
jgi:probable rRNA maturation factor